MCVTRGTNNGEREATSYMACAMWMSSSRVELHTRDTVSGVRVLARVLARTYLSLVRCHPYAAPRVKAPADTGATHISTRTVACHARDPGRTPPRTVFNRAGSSPVPPDPSPSSPLIPLRFHLCQPASNQTPAAIDRPSTASPPSCTTSLSGPRCPFPVPREAVMRPRPSPRPHARSTQAAIGSSLRSEPRSAPAQSARGSSNSRAARTVHRAPTQRAKTEEAIPNLAGSVGSSSLCGD